MSNRKRKEEQKKKETALMMNSLENNSIPKGKKEILRLRVDVICELNRYQWLASIILISLQLEALNVRQTYMFR